MITHCTEIFQVHMYLNQNREIRKSNAWYMKIEDHGAAQTLQNWGNPKQNSPLNTFFLKHVTFGIIAEGGSNFSSSLIWNCTLLSPDMAFSMRSWSTRSRIMFAFKLQCKNITRRWSLNISAYWSNAYSKLNQVAISFQCVKQTEYSYNRCESWWSSG